MGDYPILRVASRHDAAENEKCPRCLSVFQHFMQLESALLGCYRCGSVFVSKPVRDYNYSRIVDQLKLQQVEEAEYKKMAEITGPHERFICGCEFEAKTRAGLAAHQRSCGANST
ncbi:MAG: hypothetical protein GY774_35650 [Planctomycetes bacterium]|nr:hypothetical protein [Planctomycetota bacterium]